MSKITKEELFKCLVSNDFVPAASLDKIMERIEQREAKFAELVEAAIHYHKAHMNQGVNILGCGERLLNAVKPFLPPTSPADRLGALAKEASYGNYAKFVKGVAAIAAELREGEK